MKNDRNIEHYYDTIINEKMFSRRAALKFQVKELLGGVNFNDKRFLDIGGGSGLFCFYAAYQGAERAVCLEPSDDGSSSVLIEKFIDLKKKLKCDNVTLEPLTLQEYQVEDESFEIIMLHNSINHLDEEACIHLLENPEHKVTYRKIFERLFKLASKGSKLIICDCSRNNFYDSLGVHNPFGPTIEWHKHQAPEVWIDLLTKAGFTNPKIGWSSFNRLGNLGKFFIGNKIMAYFLRSHFCLTMDKP